VNAEYKTSFLSSLGVNLVHITIGEKNFRDSLVSFPPQGKSCMKSVFSHVINLRRISQKRHTHTHIIYIYIYIYIDIKQDQDLFNVQVQSNALTSAYFRPRGIKLL
jgi:hypothetical protein